MSIYSPGMLIVYKCSHCFMVSSEMCAPYASSNSFNTKVLCQCLHDTHRVSHSPLSPKALRRFHPSPYKIMDGHHTSLGAFTAHRGSHKEFIYSCWITPLSLLFSPLCHYPHCRWQGVLPKATCVTHHSLFFFTQDCWDCVASAPLSSSSEPKHPEHHILPHHLSPLLCAGVWSASLTLIL